MTSSDSLNRGREPLKRSKSSVRTLLIALVAIVVVFKVGQYLYEWYRGENAVFAIDMQVFYFAFESEYDERINTLIHASSKYCREMEWGDSVVVTFVPVNRKLYVDAVFPAEQFRRTDGVPFLDGKFRGTSTVNDSCVIAFKLPVDNSVFAATRFVSDSVRIVEVLFPEDVFPLRPKSVRLAKTEPGEAVMFK